MQTWILRKTKLETFWKTCLCPVGTAENLGGSNLARKCIETGWIFPCGSRTNPHTQSKVVPDISSFGVHFSTCPKLKQRNMNYRDQKKKVVNVLLMDRVLLLAPQGATSKLPKLCALLCPCWEMVWVYSISPSCGQVSLAETWFPAFATKNVCKDAKGSSLYTPHLKEAFIMNVQLAYETAVILWIPKVQPPQLKLRWVTINLHFYWHFRQGKKTDFDPPCFYDRSVIMIYVQDFK